MKRITSLRLNLHIHIYTYIHIFFMIFFCTVQLIDLDIDELMLWFEQRNRLTNRTHRIRFLQWNSFF